MQRACHAERSNALWAVDFTYGPTACGIAVPDGGLEVRIEIDGTDARLLVVDGGPGVRPDEAPRVFERCYRSAEARASGVEGAGLVLTAARSTSRARWALDRTRPSAPRSA